MTQSTEPTLLTIAELARNLDLPESTTRYYCNRFAAHLPSVGEGRRRRYKPEALEKLRTIAATMRRDKNAYAVDLALRNEEGDPSAPAPIQPQALATTALFAEQVLTHMESQTKALQDIAAAIGMFADRLSLAGSPIQAPVQPPAQEQTQEQTDAPLRDGDTPAPPVSPSPDTAILQEEITALKEQIRSSESMHQNDLEQLRKWLTRLGEAVANK